ncbi:hypothetical protein SRHO_G00145520 [Serrasalmus rhombeus]
MVGMAAVGLADGPCLSFRSANSGCVYRTRGERLKSVGVRADSCHVSAGKALLSVAIGCILALCSASEQQLERMQAGSRLVTGLSVAAMIVLTTAEGPGWRLGPNEKV